MWRSKQSLVESRRPLTSRPLLWWKSRRRRWRSWPRPATLISSLLMSWRWGLTTDDQILWCTWLFFGEGWPGARGIYFVDFLSLRTLTEIEFLVTGTYSYRKPNQEFSIVSLEKIVNKWHCVLARKWVDILYI